MSCRQPAQLVRAHDDGWHGGALQSGWKLDRRKVEAFLTAAEQAYGRSNPYHNSRHAADVVHASFLLLRSVWQPQFTKLEVRTQLSSHLLALPM